VPEASAPKNKTSSFGVVVVTVFDSVAPDPELVVNSSTPPSTVRHTEAISIVLKLEELLTVMLKVVESVERFAWRRKTHRNRLPELMESRRA
jgi:hypothetical protein